MEEASDMADTEHHSEESCISSAQGSDDGGQSLSSFHSAVSDRLDDFKVMTDEEYFALVRAKKKQFFVAKMKAVQEQVMARER